MLHLQQASFRAFVRPGDRACREKIARTKIAPIAGVVCHELPNRPVEIAQIAPADQDAIDPCLAHALRLEKNLERQIDAVGVRGR